MSHPLIVSISLEKFKWSSLQETKCDIRLPDYPQKSQLWLVNGADSVSRSDEMPTSTGSLVRPLIKLASVFGPPSPLGGGRRML